MILNNTALLQNRAFINGEWVVADSGQTFAVTNPATGELLAEVANVGAAETERAIAAANVAGPAWRATTAKERSGILRRWFDLIMANQEDLAVLLSAEQGKVLVEARGEIAYGANYIEWFAEEAKRIYGDVIAPPSNDKRIVVIKQPVGVVASITPWNFPNAMIARKVAPALAAGCTFVAKPASLTPLSALALAQLGIEAGIPPGVFNVVCGTSSSAIGGALTSSSTVRKLTFTGSTAVGKRLIADCADTVKKVSMELGGNAPFIVFDDANLDAAIAGLLASKFRNAGQTCICSNRLLVQDGIYEAFAERLAAEMHRFRVGNGLKDGITMGPLVSEEAQSDVRAFVEDARAKGARVQECGDLKDAQGSYFPPTLVLDATTDMRVFREEIFGPIAPLVRFQTEAEAIALANDSKVGLAAYFYTQDAARIWRMSEALEAGIVGVNDGVVSNEMAPFGGVKESGNGREGSRYGIDDYVEIKYLCMGGITPA